MRAKDQKRKTISEKRKRNYGRLSLFVSCLFVVLAAYSLPGSGLFDSSVVLKVYERGLGGNPDRLIGFTPEHLKKGLKIPAGHPWFVRPMGAFGEAQWKRLASDITRQSVTGLDLSERWDVEDQTLLWLGTLAPVRWLQLHHTRVTDQGIAQVSALTHLEVLSVSPKTSDTGLNALSPLRHLRELDLRGSRVSEAALQSLTVYPELHSLALNQNATDRAGKTLALLTALKELDASGAPLGDEGIAFLAALPLETFYAGPRVGDAGLRSIGQWTHLRRLDLSRTQITDAGLSSLEALKQLEALALTETPISDAALVPLSRLSGLKTLELSGTQITGGGLEFLARLPRLETLSLSWSGLTPAEAKIVAKFARLKTLILDGTPVDLQGRHPGNSLSGVYQPLAPMMDPTHNRRTPGVGTITVPALTNLKMRPNIFQGLSGLRKIQRIETQTSELNDVIAASQKQVAAQADSQPEDFLGAIDVRIKS